MRKRGNYKHIGNGFNCNGDVWGGNSNRVFEIASDRTLFFSREVEI